MEHTPPPFFKRGPAPVVRLAFFASLSLAILVLDARFRYTEGLRNVLALAAYPFQQLATAPFTLGRRVGEFFVTQERLRADNIDLRRKLLLAARDAQRYASAAGELAQLRATIGAAARIEPRAIAAETIYTGRNPFDFKIVLDKGAQHGVLAGSPVIDEIGVIGQVTRVHTLLAEVTLLTDKDQATPIQLMRNGLRAVAFGTGASGQLELRFLAASADVRVGDELVTSGIDGTYPPGLAVARVTQVERVAGQPFARVTCAPAAGVVRGRYVLVLSGGLERPPYPSAPEAAKRALPRERERALRKTEPERKRDAR